MTANDVVDECNLEIYFSDGGTAISPFGFTFTRHSCGEYPPAIQGFNISKGQAKNLAKFIIENI